MKIILFSFTQKATRLSLRLRELLKTEYQPEEILCFAPEKFSISQDVTPLSAPLKDTVASYFEKGNLLLFISACGIAVRSIAPFIKEKTNDPCVLVADELGKYVISLLSGHLGGGNAYTSWLANAIGAAPVLSTATDLNHKFAVDVFAKENHLSLSDLKYAKQISADILSGKSVGIVTEGIFPDLRLLLPEKAKELGLTCLSPVFSKGHSDVFSEEIQKTDSKNGIFISPFFSMQPFSDTLYLIPKRIVLGIGCRKNTSPEKLLDFIFQNLNEQKIFPEAVAALASIDLKKEEPALLHAADQLNVPLLTYSAKELSAVSGTFSSSPFVKNITGVDNVCERSALLCAQEKQEDGHMETECFECNNLCAHARSQTTHNGVLLQKKMPKDGMTLAVALIPPVCPSVFLSAAHSSSTDSGREDSTTQPIPRSTPAAHNLPAGSSQDGASTQSVPRSTPAAHNLPTGSSQDGASTQSVPRSTPTAHNLPAGSSQDDSTTQPASCPAASCAAPLPHFLIFAGTTEGRKLVEFLLAKKVKITACTATSYGKMLLPASPDLTVLSHRMDEAEMTALMREHTFTTVYDATHPYAGIVTSNIKKAAQATGTPYERILRPENDFPAAESHDHITCVSSMQEAVTYLSSTTGNILVTTGSKELPVLCTLPDFANRIYARILPNPEMTARAFALGIQGKHLICMQGPFTEELNTALIRQYDIQYLLTKHSGTPGGFLEKVNSAKKTGTHLVLITRPFSEQGSSLESVLAKL